ncbi:MULTISPECIES: HesB/IscA family protein [Curvivirga]|uniref:HesB/IscA family protein n=1 Tax=Curvivirga TaxID=2856846 RepID=UPI0012BC7BC2|nr:iron-sulfur cluster assembly accessory protein [Curvivirga aplysinae]MTI11451.1 iron-sulfur cluster assembly accessory protein [Curvivirga aplysinae]
MFGTGEPVLKLTDAAAARVRDIMDNAENDVLGLRVGVSNKGCSGLSYVVNYAKELKQFEEVVEDKGVKIFIDPAAVMFLIGSEMDFEESKMESRFVFSNPNETARCGCGESFSVS